MSWKGIKRQSNNANIKVWCDEMDIGNYTINFKGEIDVDGGVNLDGRDIKELPYKFGRVKGFFNVYGCKNLISRKNCPHSTFGFSCSSCSQLDSLEGCPKNVGGNFYCVGCKREFTKDEVKSLCKVERNIIV